MKIEIVKFENGNFGIRRKYRFWFYVWFEFLPKYSDNWMGTMDDVVNFCEYPSGDVAQKRLSRYLGKNEPPKDVGTPVDKLQ